VSGRRPFLFLADVLRDAATPFGLADVVVLFGRDHERDTGSFFFPFPILFFLEIDFSVSMGHVDLLTSASAPFFFFSSRTTVTIRNVPCSWTRRGPMRASGAHCSFSFPAERSSPPRGDHTNSPGVAPPISICPPPLFPPFPLLPPAIFFFFLPKLATPISVPPSVFARSDHEEARFLPRPPGLPFSPPPRTGFLFFPEGTMRVFGGHVSDAFPLRVSNKTVTGSPRATPSR